MSGLDLEPTSQAVLSLLLVRLKALVAASTLRRALPGQLTVALCKSVAATPWMLRAAPCTSKVVREPHTMGLWRCTLGQKRRKSQLLTALVQHALW